MAKEGSRRTTCYPGEPSNEVVHGIAAANISTVARAASDTQSDFIYDTIGRYAASKRPLLHILYA